MKRIPLLALLLTAALAWSAPSLAQVRIAAINAGELVQGSPQFKRAEKEMREEFEARAKKLQASAEKLKGEIERFQRDRDIMSSSDRASKEKALNTQRIDQNYAEQQFQEDLARRRQELFQRVLQDISQVIEAVAKEGKYDIVVQDPVYVADSIDITDTVLKRLNK